MKSSLAINPSLPEQNILSGRVYFLDNLKTFIILLVVGFHAAYAYSIYLSQDWYVVDPQKSQFFDVFILSAFAFMMPVMFFFFSMTFASGLSLYWVISNVMRIVMQYFFSGWGGLGRLPRQVLALIPSGKGRALPPSGKTKK